MLAIFIIQRSHLHQNVGEGSRFTGRPQRTRIDELSYVHEIGLQRNHAKQQIPVVFSLLHGIKFINEVEAVCLSPALDSKSVQDAFIFTQGLITDLQWSAYKLWAAGASRSDESWSASNENEKRFRSELRVVDHHPLST